MFAEASEQGAEAVSLSGTPPLPVTIGIHTEGREREETWLAHRPPGAVATPSLKQPPVAATVTVLAELTQPSSRFAGGEK